MNSDDDDTFVATITQLVLNFQAALTGVLPVAERSMLSWSDRDASPVWEKLAEVLFDTFVASPIRSDVSRGANDLPLPRYDIDVEDLSRHSWVNVDSGDGTPQRLVRLLTTETSFDTVQLARLRHGSNVVEARHSVLLADVEFSLVRRSSDGSEVKIFRIEAEE